MLTMKIRIKRVLLWKKKQNGTDYLHLRWLYRKLHAVTVAQKAHVRGILNSSILNETNEFARSNCYEGEYKILS